MSPDISMDNTYESIFVARQPIFDDQQDVWGYELLFRASAEAGGANVADGDLATAKVIADGFVLASDGMSTGQRALVNFPQNLILDQFAYALPSDIAVIEILEDVRPEPEVLEALQGLKDSGYTLAMDDFMGETELMPFVEMADILKVDILGILGPEGIAHADKLRKVMADLGSTNCRLLAEKVEDLEVFSLCKELGFTLFQGYFFAKPEIIPGKKISSNEIAKIQLLKELGAPDFDVNRLSKIIQLDPSLSYRLFRYINSAGMGVSQKVESVTRAITLLGQRQLSQWLRVVIMSDLAPTKKGQEVAFMSVQRGRFLELLAQQCPSGQKPETLFLLGLFSLLDAMLGQTMDEVLKHVPLDKAMEDALKGGESEFRFCLDLTKAYEYGDWEAVERMIAPHGITQPQAAPLYTEAMAWTQNILGDCNTPDCA
ncbi:EAL and HDOD domain-containing protein [Desulfovibrio ferrophilus]|uniref:Diguanylate phosphodiesterase metal dependent hydrolase domain containing protein n=1 Tax=Desulfovibrio ferrophilus TaxID=241368 RepID=A0A2Z6B2K8_9BACT|nr:HDOD domain-containing protein [Desulfovibrio ferrophilus]BBD09749.1 diguanylate phosphodiesterase metal dependent hydrolase domain containing protein [Desulfovibrio ferrophilus]